MRIKFNVGGTIFETTKDTCLRSTYLSAIISKRWNDTDNNEPIFIDNSPEIFTHVLAFMRNSCYPFPPEYHYELDYFGIEYIRSTGSADQQLDKLDRIINIQKDCSDYLNKLVDVTNDIISIHKECSGYLDKLVTSSNIVNKHFLPTKECQGRYCTTLIPKDGSNYCDSCSGCWLSSHLVMTSQGWVVSDSLKEGDMVRTDIDRYSKIKEVLKNRGVTKKMVTIGSVTVTHGHPIMIGGEWYRAREKGNVIVMENVDYMNLVLDSTHHITIKNEKTDQMLTVATFGKFSNEWHK